MEKLTIEDIAKQALELDAEVAAITARLNAKKETLREMADGESMNLTVEGLGKVQISKPREAGSRVVTSLDEKRLAKVPGLKEALIAKKVIVVEDKVVPAAVASITLKRNV